MTARLEEQLQEARESLKASQAAWRPGRMSRSHCLVQWSTVHNALAELITAIEREASW